MASKITSRLRSTERISMAWILCIRQITCTEGPGLPSIPVGDIYLSHVHTSACACGIDTHTHVIPESFPAYIGGQLPADWPSMAPAQACHRNVMISGKVYRTVSDKCWDTGKRLADLPGMGLKLQVVSPMPELLSYWMQPADAQQLLRYLNDQIAVMVAESGGALAGFGAVPLQDMGLALRELEYVVKVLGFPGV